MSKYKLKPDIIFLFILSFLQASIAYKTDSLWCASIFGLAGCFMGPAGMVIGFSLGIAVKLFIHG